MVDERSWLHGVSIVNSTGSTNADLRARALTGAPEGTVLVADEQTAGRGRWSRTWQTPPGSGLAVSVIVRPAGPAASWGWLPLLTGLAAVAAVREVADGQGLASLKWPNDVMVQDQKLAGILVERVETDMGPAAVVGLGMNVTMRTDQLPVPVATSLRIAGIDADRDTVLHAYLTSLQERYERWATGTAMVQEYREACVTLGRSVTVALPGGTVVRGRAVAVDDGGCLVVQTSNGSVSLASGEVQHLR